jgi:hypothetical protein
VGELRKHGAALTLARKAGQLPQGVAAVNYSADYFSTNAFHLVQARQASEILALEVLVQSDQGNGEEAWTSSLAILGLSRHMSEPPGILVQVARVALQHRAVRCLEKTLVYCRLEEPQLRDAQERLEKEARHLVFLEAMRGERAAHHHRFQSLRKNAPEMLDVYNTVEFRGNFVQRHAVMLPALNQLVALARNDMPLHAKAEALEDFYLSRPEVRHVVRFILDGSKKAVAAAQLSQTTLGTASVGMALARFREKNGKWPQKLAELISAKLIEEIPADPYTGGPLHYRRTSDGVVVFSVGPNADYRGTLRDGVEPGDSPILEFRLWESAFATPKHP